MSTLRPAGAAVGAVLERGPDGRTADGTAVDATGRPGHDQAAGGGRRPSGLDLLPHVPGDGVTVYLSNGGDAGARAADRVHASPKTMKLYRPRAAQAEWWGWSMAALASDPELAAAAE